MAEVKKTWKLKWGKCSRCQKPRKAEGVYACDCWDYDSPVKPKRKEPVDGR